MDNLFDFSSHRWFEASHKRRSVRVFNAPPTAEQKERLAVLAKTLANRGIRIVLADDAKAVFSGLLGRSISGAEYAALFVAREDTPLERVGYTCETLVLECAALDLGTCWIQGTYNRKAARRLAGLGEGETLVALTPIGHPAEGPLHPLPESRRHRKDMQTLTGLSPGEFDKLHAWQQTGLMCARNAPSSMNRQPWRFEAGADSLAVRLAPMNTAGQWLSCGIAMLHLELGAAEDDVRGRWRREGAVWRFSPASAGKPETVGAEPDEPVPEEPRAVPPLDPNPDPEPTPLNQE